MNEPEEPDESLTPVYVIGLVVIAAFFIWLKACGIISL